MMYRCKNCNNKIILTEDMGSMDGNLVTCNVCKEESIFHSHTFSLENRLAELDQELIKKEFLINDQNTRYNEKINLLEKELINKRNELDKQSLLEEKILNFENRITDTEKLNSHQADLETKIFELEKNVKKTVSEISDKNMNIEKKANYLEMKADSINKKTKLEKKLAVNESPNDVLNFRSYEKKEILSDSNKNKGFFWTSKDDK